MASEAKVMHPSSVPDKAPVGGEPVEIVAEGARQGKGSTADSYKIQIKLSPQSKVRLDHLVNCTEAETSTQVVRDALRVYDILVDELTSKGSSLFLKSADDTIVKLRLF